MEVTSTTGGTGTQVLALEGCTLSHAERPQFTPLRSVFVTGPTEHVEGSEALTGITASVVDCSFVTGTESHLMFDAIDLDAMIMRSTFVGATTLAVQDGTARVVMDELTASDVMSPNDGGFVQASCDSASTECSFSVTNTVLRDVRTQGEYVHARLCASRRSGLRPMATAVAPPDL